MPAYRLVIVSTLATLALLSSAPGAEVGAQTRPPLATTFRIIVHPRNPTDAVERKFVADAYLKKVTRWGHMEQIRPVDQRPDAAARRFFSDQVLRRSVGAVKSYWQQLVFSGRDVPPPEFDSEDDVVKYVLRYPGAIGYVSDAADLRGAKVLAVK